MAGFVLAGLALGAAAVFKHTALYFLLVLPANWLLIRKYGRHHFTLGAAAAVIIGYLAGMSWAFGSEFWDQYGVQFSRAVGLTEARGSIGTLDILKAAMSTYAIFLGTISCGSGEHHPGALQLDSLCVQTGVWALSEVRAASTWHGRWPHSYRSAPLSLKLPQYMMLILIPLFMYSGTEVLIFIRANRAKQARQVVVAVRAGADPRRNERLYVHLSDRPDR